MNTYGSARQAPHFSPWLRSLPVHLGMLAVGNLLWETAHLPLYTIWRDGSASEQAFAVFHCTLGDLLIALSTFLLALVLVGHRSWPASRFWMVVGVAIPLGVGYTIYSEWLNVSVRRTWTYSELMPVVSLGSLQIGLSPILQWIVLPAAAFVYTRQWNDRRTT